MAPRIIILGAGLGGLSAGIALKRQLDFYNFTIYEQSSDISGTWNDNTYPGCASDIPTHWYSLSTDLNPYWNQTHVLQPELKAYWKQLAIKYSLYDHIALNTKVVAVEWSAKDQKYKVELRDLKNDQVSVEYAEVVISALGALCIPYSPPELKAEVFKGHQFHSARWDHNYDLHGKRVAVIGNGCSAAQFVPIITADPTTHVVNFCRSPQWYLPAIREKFSPAWKWAFAHIPFALRAYRNFLMARSELFYVSVLSKKDNLQEKVPKLLEAYIRKQAPEEYLDRVIPKFSVGCKRVIVDTGYLSCLHRPNFDVNYDGIVEFTENGILTKKGEELSFDVVINATGFVTDNFPLKVVGTDGVSIQDYFANKGGPEAYLGTAVPGFPNFFMLLGPNTGTGHASIVFTEEVQINYAMHLIKPIVQQLASSFEVKSTVHERFNKEMQQRLSTSVWSGCTSWYRKGHNGKVVSLWPGTMTEFWWRMRSPVWNHYKVVNGEKWAKKRRFQTLARTFGLASLVLALVWARNNQDVLRLLFTRFVVRVIQNPQASVKHALALIETSARSILPV